MCINLALSTLQMVVANAWHARPDVASSLVVGLGIVGNLAGYPLLDPLPALIVDLMDRAAGQRHLLDALPGALQAR